MMVSEQQLSNFTFSECDAVLLTDSIQVEFLKARANSSLDRSWLCPLSTQAYAKILRSGHGRTRSYFEFIDFDECKKWHHGEALRLSRGWLKVLGLQFQVEGIDVAELDGPCQFQLFVHARYLEQTAERLVQALPDVDRFFVIEAENRLPHEFYFDSDAAAGIFRFLCGRLRRQVEN